MLSVKPRSKRVIYLPAVDKRVPLGTYLTGIKAAIANPDAEFSHGLTCWSSCTGAEIRKQFRRGIHNRINQSIPYIQRGQM